LLWNSNHENPTKRQEPRAQRRTNNKSRFHPKYPIIMVEGRLGDERAIPD
jgi:hypothetical protein